MLSQPVMPTGEESKPFATQRDEIKLDSESFSTVYELILGNRSIEHEAAVESALIFSVV